MTQNEDSPLILGTGPTLSKVKKYLEHAGTKTIEANIESQDFGRFLILLIDGLSSKTISEITARCSSTDTFVLLIHAFNSEHVEVGPLIPPKTPGALEAAVLKRTKHEQKKNDPKNISDLANEFTRDAIRDALSDPVFSFLWTIREFKNGLVTTRSAQNSSLALGGTNSSHFSLEKFLNPRLSTDKTLLSKIRKAAENGELVSFREALHPAFAEAVYRSLDGIENWDVVEVSQAGFSIHHHNVYDGMKWPPAVLTCQLVFGSQGTKKWISEMTGQNTDAPMTLSPSWYRPGDFSSPHTDFFRGRSVAFVWHLTKNWNPVWGGNFYWGPACRAVPPTFNSLHLFNVTKGSVHSVTAVLPQASGKRLAVNGWWNQPDSAPYLKTDGNESSEQIVKLDSDGLVVALKPFETSPST